MTATTPTKGCCANCAGSALNKRACVNCGLKYCEKCTHMFRRATCTKCNPLPAGAEDLLVTEKICADCNAAKGESYLRCVVCGRRHCIQCESTGLGAKPEGVKCVTCVGKMPHQLLVPKLFVDRILTNRLPRDTVSVNGQFLSQVEVWVLACDNVFPEAGAWWYDPRSGWFGKRGKGPESTIKGGLVLGGRSLDADCSNGDTSIFINGRHIKASEKTKFSLAGVQLTPGHWFYDHSGDYGPNFGPDAGKVIGNFWKKVRNRAAIGAGLVAAAVVGAGMIGGEVFQGGGAFGGGEAGGAYGFADAAGAFAFPPHAATAAAPPHPAPHPAPPSASARVFAPPAAAVPAGGHDAVQHNVDIPRDHENYLDSLHAHAQDRLNYLDNQESYANEHLNYMDSNYGF